MCWYLSFPSHPLTRVICSNLQELIVVILQGLLAKQSGLSEDSFGLCISCLDFGIDLLPKVPHPCCLSSLSKTRIGPSTLPSLQLPRTSLSPMGCRPSSLARCTRPCVLWRLLARTVPFPALAHSVTLLLVLRNSRAFLNLSALLETV